MNRTFLKTLGMAGLVIALAACKSGGSDSNDNGVNPTSNNFTLTVTKTGTGSGTVTSDVAGINCGASCSGLYAQNTVVKLTASASAGSNFAGWGGDADCSDGTVTINGNVTCNPMFNLIPVAGQKTLSISKGGTGTGTVTSTPAGINCGATCAKDFTDNTSVALTATPAANSIFSGWSGAADCADGNVTLSANVMCVATFNLKPAPSLNQAAYNTLTATYQYGYKSIANIAITGAPADTDWARWDMLHDGTRYRLYFFKSGTNDKLYQFAFNPATSKYEYGFDSIPTLTITGAPSDADPSSFAMLHDGSAYRLYMRSKTSIAVHQFAFNAATSNYEYGFNSIPKINVTGGPVDADYSRWSMLHDGTTYRFYAFKQGSNTVFYQWGFNTASSAYEYAFNSLTPITVEGMPANSDATSFSMLHDGTDYRFYFKTK